MSSLISLWVCGSLSGCAVHIKRAYGVHGGVDINSLVVVVGTVIYVTKLVSSEVDHLDSILVMDKANHLYFVKPIHTRGSQQQPYVGVKKEK